MFHGLLEAGATAPEAVQRIIVDPPGSWDDLDERVVQVLALAALEGVMNHRST